MYDLIALPMHGELTLRREGLRTRDGHLMEWIARLRPGARVAVESRPEPWPRFTIGTRGRRRLFPEWTWISPEPIALPPVRNPARWWVQSVKYWQCAPKARTAIVWNPVAGAHRIEALKRDGTRVVVDLLDDWTVHKGMRAIWGEARAAYAALFDEADVVVANSEGTQELAASYGREAVLIPNGCDPERFSVPARKAPVATVGYAGKIGFRLDFALIRDTVSALPDVMFEFAGPVLARTRRERAAVKRQLKALPNVVLLGDVPYEDLPRVMARWHAAWVPHAIGEREVRGDAIKLYEYTAAGLPAVSTPIIGANRLDTVTVLRRADDIAEWIRKTLSKDANGRGEKGRVNLPKIHTWRTKAERFLELLQL